MTTSFTAPELVKMVDCVIWTGFFLGMFLIPTAIIVLIGTVVSSWRNRKQGEPLIADVRGTGERP